jgi:hypothetical protein
MVNLYFLFYQLYFWILEQEAMYQTVLYLLFTTLALDQH